MTAGQALAAGPRPAESDIEVAFYGDLFRAAGRKGPDEAQYGAQDVADGFERELLEAWWREAAATDASAVAPDDQTKLRTRRTVQRALNALSYSRFFTGMAEHLAIGLIKQVRLYLTDDDVRARVLDQPRSSASAALPARCSRCRRARGPLAQKPGESSRLRWFGYGDGGYFLAHRSSVVVPFLVGFFLVGYPSTYRIARDQGTATFSPA
jgi:hypothetical protein